MGRKKGKTVKGARKSQSSAFIEEQYQKAPHSFVFHRGKVGNNVSELERDIRRVMEPYTATNLKIKKGNVLKDFVSIAGPLNVSHFMVLTKTEVAINLRIMRLPRGPTLTFKVHNYTLAKDVISSLKRPNMEPKQFLHHPLLVMNNMSGEGMHMKLMTTMFQNMFPSINVTKVKLNALRRCVLLNYDDETKTIEFRHYNVRAVPVGVGRGIKKLMKTDVPNLAKYNDISELLLRGDLSESEAEMDVGQNEVELPQEMKKGKFKATKSAVRLTEIGPRLKLQLIKIEEGICEGNVLYHEYIEKTDEEMKEQIKRREKKKQLKALRKKRQEENVERKKQEKEVDRKKSLAGMKKEGDDDDDQIENPGESADEESDIDDIEYYKEEVGEMPDPDLFPTQQRGVKRKKMNDKTRVPPKKYKKATTGEDRRAPSVGKNRTKPGGKDQRFRQENKKQSQDKNKRKFPRDNTKEGGKKKRVLTDLDKIKRRKMRKLKKKTGGKKPRSQSNKTRFQSSKKPNQPRKT